MGSPAADPSSSARHSGGADGSYAAPILLALGLLYLYVFHTRPALEDLETMRAWHASVEDEMASLEAEEEALRARLAAAAGDPLYHERLLQAQFGRTLFAEEEALEKARSKAKAPPAAP